MLDPAVDRFRHRWDQAIASGDDEGRDVLIDFRSTLTQYVKAYAFFSQILNFGDPAYEKLSVFADLLARRLRAFTSEQTNPGTVDISDVVVTHYKLEKVKEEDLQLQSGQGEGLTGMTEAGMAKQREQERSPKAELIEKVNRYFGDLDEKDEYKVSTVEHLMSEALSDPALTMQALNNAEDDFAHSPTLRSVVEDAVWRTDAASGNVLEFVRRMPPETLVQMLLSFGLYDRLREQGQAG